MTLMHPKLKAFPNLHPKHFFLTLCTLCIRIISSYLNSSFSAIFDQGQETNSPRTTTPTTTVRVSIFNPQSMANDEHKTGTIEHKAYTRIGLLGNPSDVYYGKTISLSLANFWTSVKLEPSADLVIVLHPTHDLVQFKSLSHLVRILYSISPSLTLSLYIYIYI